MGVGLGVGVRVPPVFVPPVPRLVPPPFTWAAAPPFVTRRSLSLIDFRDLDVGMGSPPFAKMAGLYGLAPAMSTGPRRGKMGAP